MSLYVVFVLIVYSEIRPIMTNSLWIIVRSRKKSYYSDFLNEILWLFQQ